MFCTRCGTQNPDGAGFCLKCGAKLVVDEHASQPPQPFAATPTAAAHQTPQQPAGAPPMAQQYTPQQYFASPMLQKKKSKAPFIVLGIVGGIVALFILLIIIGMIADSQEDVPPSQQGSSVVTSSSAAEDKVKLSKTYVNSNAGIYFRYPEEWKKISEANWKDYIWDIDSALVVLVREDDDNPVFNSMILVAQFDLDEESLENEEAQEIFFSDDGTFLDWFEDEDRRIRETSVLDLDGVPTRRVTFVNSDGDRVQYYIYMVGNAIYRISFLWWGEDAGELQPVFNAVMDSYTVNVDQIARNSEPVSIEPQLPNGFEWVKMPYKDDPSSSSSNICGVIRNNSGSDRSFVMIEFYLYDANGNRVGNASDSISGLDNGDSWSFKATAWEKYVGFKFAELSGW